MTDLFNNLYAKYIGCSCQEHASRPLRNRQDYIFNIENIKCQIKKTDYNNDTVSAALLKRDLEYYKYKYEEVYKEKYMHDNMNSCESSIFMKNYLNGKSE
jgi:hypothetical protein